MARRLTNELGVSHTVDSRRDKTRVKIVVKSADKLEGSVGSHDFIKFPPNISDLPTRVWFLLGEIQARIENIQATPIPPESLKELRILYLTKGIHATTAIEGNSFSEQEVRRILNSELESRPSRQYQQQQIENMQEAFTQVARRHRAGRESGYSMSLLNEYHALVLANLKDSLEESVEIGKLREHRVQVGGHYLAAPPEDCPRLVAEFCDWLNGDMPAPSGMDIAAAVVKAFVAHVYFAAIHPYGDGNGRMARLIEFSILLRAGVPDIAAHLLSNHYNRTRDQYYMRLNETHGEYRDGAYPAKANLNPFIEYGLQGFKDELDEQFDVIHGFQRRSLWHDAIHAVFRREFSENLTEARQRQKRLVLELSDHRFDSPTAINEINDVSPALAFAYAGKTRRTLQRDINELVRLQLLKPDGASYRPNIDMLQI